MIDLILVVVFCYQLHRMAAEKGLSPWPFVWHYLGAFLLMVLLLSYTFLSVFGSDALQTEEGVRNAMYMEPIAVSFEVFLFIYLRRRIQRTPSDHEDDQEDDKPVPPPPPKKDLSYFR